MHNNIEIHIRIRNEREDHDLTQAEIAEVLHISRRQYGLYELGKTEIPNRHIIRLAIYYNVSLNYLHGFSMRTKLFQIKESEAERYQRECKHYKKSNKKSF